jgi:hypothetical protein
LTSIDVKEVLAEQETLSLVLSDVKGVAELWIIGLGFRVKVHSCVC